MRPHKRINLRLCHHNGPRTRTHTHAHLFVSTHLFCSNCCGAISVHSPRTLYGIFFVALLFVCRMLQSNRIVGVCVCVCRSRSRTSTCNTCIWDDACVLRANAFNRFGFWPLFAEHSARVHRMRARRASRNLCDVLCAPSVFFFCVCSRLAVWRRVGVCVCVCLNAFAFSPGKWLMVFLNVAN